MKNGSFIGQIEQVDLRDMTGRLSTFEEDVIHFKWGKSWFHEVKNAFAAGFTVAARFENGELVNLYCCVPVSRLTNT